MELFKNKTTGTMPVPQADWENMWQGKMSAEARVRELEDVVNTMKSSCSSFACSSSAHWRITDESNFSSFVASHLEELIVLRKQLANAESALAALMADAATKDGGTSAEKDGDTRTDVPDLLPAVPAWITTPSPIRSISTAIEEIIRADLAEADAQAQRQRDELVRRLASGFPQSS
jgi:hypothetical protein